MPIKIVPNITGTHIRKGFLQVRFDLFIDEPLSKTYPQQYVNVPVIGSNVYTGKLDKTGSPVSSTDYQLWLDSLPHIWQLNPALIKFVSVPETVKLDDIEGYAKTVFTQDVIATLDDIIALPDSLHRVSPFMKNTGKFTTTAIKTADPVDLVLSVKTILNGLVISGDSDGKVSYVEPQSIDAGVAAIDRATVLSIASRTVWNVANPANADGVLDSFEVWLQDAGNTCYVGTVSGSGPYSSRDRHYVGSISAGSKTTINTAVSVDVVTGDFAALSNGSDTSAIERDDSGSGISYVGDADLDFTGQSSTDVASRTISLYATGTESGGATAYEASLTTSIGMSATMTRGAGTFNRTATTAIGMSPALSRGGSTFARSLSTAVGMDTSLTSIKTIVRSISTAIGMAATLTRGAGTFGRTISTSIGLSPTITRSD